MTEKRKDYMYFIHTQFPFFGVDQMQLQWAESLSFGENSPTNPSNTEHSRLPLLFSSPYRLCTLAKSQMNDFEQVKETTDAHPPPKKRRRVPEACHVCRRRYVSKLITNDDWLYCRKAKVYYPSTTWSSWLPSSVMAGDPVPGAKARIKNVYSTRATRFSSRSIKTAVHLLMSPIFQLDERLTRVEWLEIYRKGSNFSNPN